MPGSWNGKSVFFFLFFFWSVIVDRIPEMRFLGFSHGLYGMAWNGMRVINEDRRWCAFRSCWLEGSGRGKDFQIWRLGTRVCGNGDASGLLFIRGMVCGVRVCSGLFGYLCLLWVDERSIVIYASFENRKPFNSSIL